MSIVTVAIVITEGFSTFHVSVPLIMFGEILEGNELFSRRVCAEEPGLIWSAEGTAVRAEYGLDALAEADIVIIPFWKHIHEKPSEKLLSALVEAWKNGSQVVGLCLGSFVLAYTGLLDGKRAATHWEAEGDFQMLFPAVHLDVNVLYVEDERIITSAGTVAALDCCLHVVRQRLGSHTANLIARRMVAPPYREGGQAQYRQMLIPKSTSDNRINQLLEYLSENLGLPHEIDTLANLASMSRRTLTRHFHAATSMTVWEWITGERLRRSQELLESTDISVEQVAELAGFQSAITFRQMFRQRMGVSPSEWRKTFNGTSEGNISARKKVKNEV
ncbi:helix-turn-helix domain-containing protein [Salmonella enterica]|uniref:Helix-turn-helix domain-containing protein n=1 Tax=Salmonella enterica TaxID=28901 RepID=A0A5Y2ZXP0_SALER|nr:helix-turn-helix domain-containing protein [Salmonella enterica]EAS0935814.1 helix-turn-helix domain-containing protein [Salmonella enterica]EAT9250862.1 helix-turn-helix domain-containing protein [Salmonella enterica]EAV7952749.1 helix-turn-helix domain-containing protein [Salmonella enterica]EAV9265008.1 helix-turn-helix domain-containing protein [Salmonella enterica]